MSELNNTITIALAHEFTADIVALLNEHLNEMRAVSPPESTHALDLEALHAKNISFWTARQGETLFGCGALLRLNANEGEVKSMRVKNNARNHGVASLILNTIINTAKSEGLSRLNLETGSMAFFEPARQFYLKHGFQYCEPFADYCFDPNSVFMKRAI